MKCVTDDLVRSFSVETACTRQEAFLIDFVMDFMKLLRSLMNTFDVLLVKNGTSKSSLTELPSDNTSIIHWHSLWLSHHVRRQYLKLEEPLGDLWAPTRLFYV